MDINKNSSSDYGRLMEHRIRKILMICSSYEAYTLEEDGRLEAQINREYLELNLSGPPSFTRVDTPRKAMEKLKHESDFDLIINMYTRGAVDIFHFAKELKDSELDIPVVLLTNMSHEIYKKIDPRDLESIDYIFSWYGNADLILAIIKIIEDKMNADRDILEFGVQSILLVEDSVRYYSTYLPAIYKLVIQQSSEFIKEALNERQQRLLKRARPKILLATNYEEATRYYGRYKDYILGVISDVGFVMRKTDRPEDEKLDAGIDLCKMIKKDDPLMPFLLQSSQESMREVAQELGVGFIVKYSKTLLHQLSEYISQEFAFGDFVFKNPDTGAILARAKNLKEMQEIVPQIPDESLLYHARLNHLSKWMYSRGLFVVAEKLKPMRITNFTTVEQMKTDIVKIIDDYRLLMGQGVVARFTEEGYSRYMWFSRIGDGSLGGKARGLAFLNQIMQKYRLYDRYPGVRVMVPHTLVVATDFFDEFIKENGLQHVINSDISDEELLAEFVSSRLPERLVSALRTFLKYVDVPLAIRSSSKLEDSHYQPFAGIYSTYMLPRTQNEDQMLRLLGKAIKSVYASVYFASSRAYISATGNVLSDEKMAVVIQEVCGSGQDGLFFPTISGVAQSINYYPIGDEKAEEGVTKIALGLGKLVVDGGQCLRFSPKHPKNALQLSTTELALRDTQRELYTLDLKPEQFKTSVDDSVNLKRLTISEAKGFRNMDYAASTWDMESQSISDSNFEEGRKIITFAHILKYDTFPLAEIVSDMLKIGNGAMQLPVELEFAVNMDVGYGEEKIFNFLQIRTIADNHTKSALNWHEIDTDDTLIYSESALGVGQIEGVSDVVYVKMDGFESRNTEAIAEELKELNIKMKDESRGYVLIGPGRWGSSDPWLGIPVRWPHISEAKTIVECGLSGFHIDPSQGTHFMQNLTSFGIGYMTINPYQGDGKLDLVQLDSMSAIYENDLIRHVRFEEPLFIFVDGRNNKGCIKPMVAKESDSDKNNNTGEKMTKF